MNSRFSSFCYICVFVIFLSHLTWAQNQRPPQPNNSSELNVEETNNGWFMWQGRDDTSYRVRLGSVQSYGVQKYEIADAGVHVTELTIDSIGSVSARFYYIEPSQNTNQTAASRAVNRAVDRVGELTENATGFNLADLVIKSYPDTTHSHTMEYRLRSAEEIETLESALTEALDSNRGRTVSSENE